MPTLLGADSRNCNRASFGVELMMAESELN